MKLHTNPMSLFITHKVHRPIANALVILLFFSVTLTGASAASISPTTGLPTDKPYRPVLVQISNSVEARPPLNLSEADIVYEFICWGPEHTRYLAVYNDEHPDTITSIRSAQINTFELREAWDCPLVTWNGDNNETPLGKFIADHSVDKNFLFDISRDSNPKGQAVLFNIEDRQPPHNGSANSKLLVEELWPIDVETNEPYEPRLPGLQFNKNPTIGRENAQHISVSFYENGEQKSLQYASEYTFNPNERIYERWYSGKEQFDGKSGKRIVASNILIQFAYVWYRNNYASDPIVQTLGSGPMCAFINGKLIQGSWRRDDLKSPTQYLDESGNPLVLMPGKTFIQVLPTHGTVTITDENGVQQAFTGQTNIIMETKEGEKQ